MIIHFISIRIRSQNRTRIFKFRNSNFYSWGTTDFGRRIASTSFIGSIRHYSLSVSSDVSKTRRAISSSNNK
jgi:hypothetical protein